jgi:hypothetical protein
LLTVPEARNRDLVAEMVADAAPALLEHFGHPAYSKQPIAGPDEPRPLRQLWLPNGSHLDMLHHLAYAYTFAKWGDPARAKTLRALGHLCGWLFREAQRPGQQTVMVATDALRSMYTFPSDDVRQAHLGYLLAWLETKGGREKRLAVASQEEALSVSTTLDPQVERGQLETAVDRWNSAKQPVDTKVMNRERLAISRVLETEIARRYQLVHRAIECARTDGRPENGGVQSLILESKREQWYQYVRLELRLNDENDGPAFVPSPETDRHPAAAAARYFVHEASESFRLSSLVHDDVELQEEMIAAGDGIRGKIVQVWDEGEGRRTDPVWVVDVPEGGSVRIREGSELCVAGFAKRTVCVRAIARVGGGILRFEIEVTGCKTDRSVPPGELAGADMRLRGRIVTLVASSKHGIPRKKSFRVWKRDVPGAGTTHAIPKGIRSLLPDGVAEDLSSFPAGRVS